MGHSKPVNCSDLSLNHQKLWLTPGCAWKKSFTLVPLKFWKIHVIKIFGHPPSATSSFICANSLESLLTISSTSPTCKSQVWLLVCWGLLCKLQLWCRLNKRVWFRRWWSPAATAGGSDDTVVPIRWLPLVPHLQVIQDSRTGQAELELFPRHLLFLRQQPATRSPQSNIWVNMGMTTMRMFPPYMIPPRGNVGLQQDQNTPSTERFTELPLSPPLPPLILLESTDSALAANGRVNN